MSREHTFEMIEHTADVGVAGYGSSMAEAFESVACGMFAVMADTARYEPTDTTLVRASGEDEVALLQTFLSALIVLFDADAVLPLEFTINKLDKVSLECEVAYRPIADDIEWLGPAIKAVTYHLMEVVNEDGRWRAQAIFDV